MRKSQEIEQQRKFRRSKHSQPHEGDWSHKRLAEYAIRGFVSKAPIHIQHKGQIPQHVIRTCERVTKTHLKVKPKTYVYHPTKCIKWNDVEDYSGMGATQWDADTKTMDKAVIVIPENVYKDNLSREAVYAHEYTELLGEQQGKSEREAHKTAMKSESIIAREHGTTRREILSRTRKSFKDEYVCKTRAKPKHSTDSVFMRQSKERQYF